MVNPPDRLIAEVHKNAREQFRVQLRSYKGVRNVDLRVFASNGVDLVPTGKGVSIKPSALGRIIEALTAARTAAEAEGLET